LVRVAVADAEEAFAWVEAKAPVRARAMTKARTMFFMDNYSLFGYSEWADLNISLDFPDEVTLGCMVA
jgi:hypothetical protein